MINFGRWNPIGASLIGLLACTTVACSGATGAEDLFTLPPGGDASPPLTPTDASLDGAKDAATDTARLHDGAVEPPVDTGSPMDSSSDPIGDPIAHDAAEAGPWDAQHDGGADAPVDADAEPSIDGAQDSAVEAAQDGETDATSDAGPEGGDGGPTHDAPTDSPSDASVDGSDGGGGDAGTVALRVYVAGEYVEAHNRFDYAPFTDAGALNRSWDNDDNEYGWMVPMADRLRLRDARFSVEWVGSDTWKTHNGDSTGAYPTRVRAPTSALEDARTDEWIADRREELQQKRYCYDVAFVARGFRDLGRLDEAEFKDRLSELVLLVDGGSNCRTHPMVVVVTHMPDEGTWNGRYDGASLSGWMQEMVSYYQSWPTQLVSQMQAAHPGLRLVLVDSYGAFMTNKSTTAFPSPDWTYSWSGATYPALPDMMFSRDLHAPRRKASIYLGEVIADGLPLGTLSAID